MVSRQGRKFLKWMYKHDEMMYFHEISQKCEFDVDYSLVETLRNGGYLMSWEPPDAIPMETLYEIPELMFQISDAGKALLEYAWAERWREIRNWASFIIALAAFIKSFFF